MEKKELRTVRRIAAQGDVTIIRHDGAVPPGLRPVERVHGALIVTHSETGHHHVIERPRVDMFHTEDPLISWLEVHGEESLPNVAELVHRRDYDTHETLGLYPGVYKIHRQREYTPEGYKQVQD